MIQTSLLDFFSKQDELDNSRADFYEQWAEFQTSMHVEKEVPSVENVRKRLGPVVAKRYQTLLAQVEDAGITYNVSSNENMNGRTIHARIRTISECLSSHVNF